MGQQKVIDFFQNIYAYVKFWVQDAIQPAIVRQATNLYVGGQKVINRTVDGVHSHVLYLELTKQSKVYIQMASIPVEYTSYIIDGALIVFAFSSLMVLFMALGLVCDCCCPKKPVKISQSKGKEQSPVYFSEGKKNKGKNKN